MFYGPMAMALGLLAQATEAPAPFDWDQALFALLITAVVLGGLIMVEAVHRPRRAHRHPRPQRRAPASGAEVAPALAELRWPERVWWGRAVVAGLVATAVFTLLAALAPSLGLPPMDVPAMLASALGGVQALGWVAHFAIGVALTLIYALWFATALPGPLWARGAVFSLLPFFAAQLVVTPMMGGGFFSANLPQAGTLVTMSLVVHLVYGMVMGAVYSTPPAEAAALAPEAPQEHA